MMGFVQRERWAAVPAWASVVIMLASVCPCPTMTSDVAGAEPGCCPAEAGVRAAEPACCAELAVPRQAPVTVTATAPAASAPVAVAGFLVPAVQPGVVALAETPGNPPSPTPVLRI
jgi:hypothetical protein